MKNWREGIVLDQTITEKDNKLDKLLENASPEVREQFNETLKKILPDKRAGDEGIPVQE